MAQRPVERPAEPLEEGIVSKRLLIKNSIKSNTKRNYNKSLLNILLNYVIKVKKNKSQEKNTNCSISLSEMKRKYLDNNKLSEEMKSQRLNQNNCIKNERYIEQ